MINQATYNPRDYTIEQLETAARGDSTIMPASLAVALLEAHPDVDTQSTMLRLVQDESADPRGRRSAARALAPFPDAAPVLRALTESPDARLAEAARKALGEQG
jgi:hypothetical protein